MISVLANSEYHGASLGPNNCEEYEHRCVSRFFLLTYFCLFSHAMFLLFSLTLIIRSCVICFVGLGEHNKMGDGHDITPSPKDLLLKEL